MRIAVDSSTLISLAWAGQLDVLSRAPVDLVVPEGVRREVVDDGLARGHPDAAAIERAITGFEVVVGPATPEMDSVDGAVLAAGQAVGAVLTNDLALGRRAANLGVRWLRTADLVSVCVRVGAMSVERGVAALHALHSAGRITETVRDEFLEELR